MKPFSIDIEVASIHIRLAAIGFVEVPKFKGNHIFQHRHNLFELQYVTNGRCETKIGNRMTAQDEGEVYLIAPGIFHSQKSSTLPFEKMCIMFEAPAPPPGAPKTVRDIYMSLTKSDYLRCDAETLRGVLEAIKDICGSYENKLCGIDEMRVLTELLMLRLIQQICTADKAVPSADSVREERQFIIDEFFNLNFNINDGGALLAEQLGVSVRQLSRILNNLYGMGYRDKLKEIRLEVSQDLLTAGKSVSEVSEIMGYSCPANFSTFIKNTAGKTPSELRREMAER